MAMPKSQDVLSFLINTLTSEKRYSRPYFVGLRKKDEKWEWIDDTPLSQGLPNDQYTDFQSCAVLHEGSLRKMPCEEHAGYICELKKGKYKYTKLIARCSEMCSNKKKYFAFERTLNTKKICTLRILIKIADRSIKLRKGTML